MQGIRKVPVSNPVNTKKHPMNTPLIGTSDAIAKIRELIAHVADTGLNTLITGESGVGKEVVAQGLYQSSRRKGKPFVKINCAALPEGLLESELFGYEKGAFTGADQKTRGKFALAHKGVLFLDEIGDMSLRLQAKLLHVLQCGEFTPLGSEKDYRSDSWIIAATNQTLEQCVEKKLFREDLYYRLNIINIDIPPLRSRPDDIPPLVEYYIARYTAQFETRNLKMPPSPVMDRLCQYEWPGNVRELQNILKRYVVVSDWNAIANEISSLSFRTQRGKCLPPEAPETLGETSPNPWGATLAGQDIFDSDFSLKKAKKRIVDMVESEIISHVLDKTNWNRSKASKLLKISYKTLLYKISELGLTPP